MKKRKMSKIITIEVGNCKHKITSQFIRESTVNVFRNMAYLLEDKYPAIKFIEADKVKK